MKRVAGAVLLCGIVASSPASSADVLELAKPQFSSRVSDDGNYTVIGPAINGTISRKTLEQGRLFFSVTLLARDRTIEYLRDKGLLDVYAVIFGNGVRRDTVSFGITQQRWFEVGKVLTKKYDEEGYFPFRTFMYTQQTQHSSIEILVRDGTGNTVGRWAVNIVP
jgi:hypothetical protein